MKPPDSNPSRLTAWRMATRPRTLPAALGPVVIGTAAAETTSESDELGSGSPVPTSRLRLRAQSYCRTAPDVPALPRCFPNTT